MIIEDIIQKYDSTKLRTMEKANEVLESKAIIYIVNGFKYKVEANKSMKNQIIVAMDNEIVDGIRLIEINER